MSASEAATGESQAATTPTTDARPTDEANAPAGVGGQPRDERPYSPGLEGVVAAETALGLVDGTNGRLLYRGYPIGQLVQKGTYASVAELLWTGEWNPKATLHPAPVPWAVVKALRELPHDAHPMDALRTAVSVWGATQRLGWPPTVEQARALTAFAPSALAAFARIRQGLEPVDRRSITRSRRRLPPAAHADASRIRAAARALDAYFIVGAEHGLNASTFTARVITSTRSDIASAVTGAIGALKGPLHGGAPSEVVDQLHEIGSPERAEQWIREPLARGERLMGFGHRVYRAYDPRAAALRKVAEGMAGMADWLASRRGRGRRAAGARRAAPRPGTQDERRVLRGRRAPGRRPRRRTCSRPRSRSPATPAGRPTSSSRHAANRLIRPDVRYTGHAERDLPD